MRIISKPTLLRICIESEAPEQKDKDRRNTFRIAAARLRCFFPDEIGFNISPQEHIYGKGNERADQHTGENVAGIVYADITSRKRNQNSGDIGDSALSPEGKSQREGGGKA